MNYRLSRQSLDRLIGVHPDLVRVVKRALQISELDFTVLEGLRGILRQEELVAAGASNTMNSRHLNGHAVDLGAYVGGTIRWDWPLYHKLAAAMKTAAKELSVPLEWGGDWRDKDGARMDGPHFQLPWKDYP